MMSPISWGSRLWRHERGVAAIEFCLTLPVLLMLTVGAYDVSQLISARIALQQALTEVEGLAIAQPPQGDDFSYLTDALAAAGGVPAANVSVRREISCNGTVVTSIVCPSVTDHRAIFVVLTLERTYIPTSTHFGVARPVPMRITRTIRVG